MALREEGHTRLAPSGDKRWKQQNSGCSELQETPLVSKSFRSRRWGVLLAVREEVGRDEKRSRGCRREGDSGARGAAVAWASAKQATTVPVYRGSNVLGRSALQQLPL